MTARRALQTALVIAFALTAGPTISRAHVELYGTLTPIHISGVASGNTTGTNSQYTTSSYWAPGFGGGATVTAFKFGPASLGIDLRGSTKPGTQGADTVLGGVKLAFKPPVLPIKPYVQVSGGYLGTRGGVTTGAAAGSANPQHFAAYEFLGGLDYSILPLVRLRLIEIGGGQGHFLSGANNNDPNITFFTVNTGVVFHL